MCIDELGADISAHVYLLFLLRIWLTGRKKHQNDRYRHVTFLCGKGGVYAVGAVVADLAGDHPRRDVFINLFLEVYY